MEQKSATTEETRYDEGAEMHDPDLYRHDRLAEPINGLDGITEDHIARYRRDGFLAVEGAFPDAEVADARDGLMHLIMGGNPEFQGVVFEAKARDILPDLGPEARQDAVRKLANFVEYDRRLRALSHHPKLLAVLERLLGEPPVLFQDMALLKPPHLGREKPWHQDHSYFNFPLETRVVGVWIALDEATLENGCMRLLAGAHLDGPVVHFKRRDWQICDTDVSGKTGVVAAPLKPGGLLLFDGLLPHGTPHNNTSKRRRALQYHYHNQSAQKWSAKERMAIFGSEGKDVSC